MFDLPGRIDARIRYDPPKLDARDHKILEALVKNARTPVSRIAKRVRLSRDAVAYRIRRLEQRGILLSAYPLLSHTMLGFSTFHVFLLLDETDAEARADFFRYLEANDHVRSVIEFTDRWDVELTILAPDVAAFDETLLEITDRFADLILDKTEALVVKRFNSASYPGVYDPRLDEPGVSVKADLDDTDLAIIHELCVDARQSTYVIGERVGVSADTVRYRMKRLEEVRVIRGYTILVNLSVLGWTWRSFSMEVKTFNKRHESLLTEFLRQHPRIIRAVKLLGHDELYFHVLSSNPSEFHSTIKSLKQHFADIITRYDTLSALVEHFYRVAPPVSSA